jgi:hypothetical protein
MANFLKTDEGNKISNTDISKDCSSILNIKPLLMNPKESSDREDFYKQLVMNGDGQMNAANNHLSHQP